MIFFLWFLAVFWKGRIRMYKIKGIRIRNIDLDTWFNNLCLHPRNCQVFLTTTYTVAKTTAETTTTNKHNTNSNNSNNNFIVKYKAYAVRKLTNIWTKI